MPTIDATQSLAILLDALDGEGCVIHRSADVIEALWFGIS